MAAPSEEHPFPRYRLLGNEYACVDAEQLARWLVNASQAGRAGYVCIANVHTATSAWLDLGYRRCQQQSLLSVPDGMPLVWAGRLLGQPAARAYGAEVMWHTLDVGRAAGVRHFLLGGSQALLDALQRRVAVELPGAEIAGAIAPPTMDIDDPRWEMAWQQAAEAEADLLWVGLGAPKQERLMARYASVGLLQVGVGQAFALEAGTVPRTPKLLQRLGLEWAFRLAREPRRLWRRYLVYNALFLVGAPLDLVRQRLAKSGRG